MPFNYLDHHEFDAVISAYPEIPWLRDYYAVDNYSVRWHPYVYFLMIPMKNPYMNIDEQGVRRTRNAPRGASTSPVRSLRIFIFGGSTM